MKIPILAVIVLCASASLGQSIKNVPTQYAAFVSTDGTGNPGTWAPLTGTGGTAQSSVFKQIGIYYSTDGTGNPGTWAPWKGGGGAPGGVAGGDLSGTYPNPVVAKASNGLVIPIESAGISWPSGSSIVESLTGEDVNLVLSSAGQTLAIVPSDTTNTGNIVQLSGASAQTNAFELDTGVATGYLIGTTIAGNLLSSSNARETQLGIGLNSGANPPTFAASFAVGDTITTDKNRTVVSPAGALSSPALLLNGAPVTSGGSGTTTWPLALIQPNGTTSAAWNTAGTMFGVNAASGFTGNLFDFQANGSSFLHLSDSGILSGNNASFVTYATATTCANAASPAVCAAAPSGSVAVPVGGPPATLVVQTTRVTANSQILLTFDSSLGARLSVTCNTTVNQPTVSARTAGTSFTISMATISTNPDCISYTIIN